MTSSRLNKVRLQLEKNKIQALLLIHPANISYITGFKTEDSFLFVNDKRCFLITDFRYLAEYDKKLKNRNIQLLEIEKDIFQMLKTISAHQRITQLHFEQDYTSFAFYQKLKEVFKKIFPAKEIIEELRLTKEPKEVLLIKKAVSLIKLTFKTVIKKLKKDISEFELANELEYFIKKHQGFGLAFEPIVAFGENSSFPHAQKTKRRLKYNEPVLLDIGAEFEGYKSDLTRTYFFGKMSSHFKVIYEIVKEAKQRAILAIKPGIAISEIDKVARNFIKSKGLKQYFKHSLGHGIGLEVHEQPRINSQNSTLIKPGMVFTIEPAVYLPKQFGIRLEDVIYVSRKGAEIL